MIDNGDGDQYKVSLDCWLILTIRDNNNSFFDKRAEFDIIETEVIIKVRQKLEQDKLETLADKKEQLKHYGRNVANKIAVVSLVILQE